MSPSVQAPAPQVAVASGKVQAAGELVRCPNNKCQNPIYHVHVGGPVGSYSVRQCDAKLRDPAAAHRHQKCGTRVFVGKIAPGMREVRALERDEFERLKAEE